VPAFLKGNLTSTASTYTISIPTAFAKTATLYHYNAVSINGVSFGEGTISLTNRTQWGAVLPD